MYAYLIFFFLTGQMHFFLFVIALESKVCLHGYLNLVSFYMYDLLESFIC